MLRKFRIFLGILGLAAVAMAAAGSDAHPDWTLRSICPIVSGGLFLFWWGIRPYENS